MLWGQMTQAAQHVLVVICWMYVPVRPLAGNLHARLRIRFVHSYKCLHDFCP